MTEAINWQKSSFSGPDDNQSCVELALIEGLIKLRESDDPGVIVTTSPAKLRAFLLGVKAGESITSSEPAHRPARQFLTDHCARPELLVV